MPMLTGSGEFTPAGCRHYRLYDVANQVRHPIFARVYDRLEGKKEESGETEQRRLGQGQPGGRRQLTIHARNAERYGRDDGRRRRFDSEPLRHP